MVRVHLVVFNLFYTRENFKCHDKTSCSIPFCENQRKLLQFYKILTLSNTKPKKCFNLTKSYHGPWRIPSILNVTKSYRDWKHTTSDSEASAACHLLLLGPFRETGPVASALRCWWNIGGIFYKINTFKLLVFFYLQNAHTNLRKSPCVPELMPVAGPCTQRSPDLSVEASPLASSFRTLMIGDGHLSMVFYRNGALLMLQNQIFVSRYKVTSR